MTTQPLHPGLAIAALVLGIVSLVFSLFVIGALFGLVGLVLGVLYLRRHRREPRGMAVSGIVLSGVGLLASAAFGTLYYFLFSTALGIVGSPANSAALLAWQGVAAPDFTVTTLDGQVLQLSELKGRRVVVDFWATWCGPCVRDVPHFNQLVEQHSADELVLVAISKESRQVIEPFIEEHAVRFPTASANGLPVPYSLVSVLPTRIFIDRNGVIQSVSFGSGSYEKLAEQALADDYSGEPRAAPASTSG